MQIQILQKETKKHSEETTGLKNDLKTASKNCKLKEKEIYRLEQTVQNAQETCNRLKGKNSELTSENKRLEKCRKALEKKLDKEKLSLKNFHPKVTAAERDSNLNTAPYLPSFEASISSTNTTALESPSLTSTLFPILPLGEISTHSMTSFSSFTTPSSPISDSQSTDILNNKMPNPIEVSSESLPAFTSPDFSSVSIPTRAPPSTPPHTPLAPPSSSSPGTPPGTPPCRDIQHYFPYNTSDDFIDPSFETEKKLVANKLDLNYKATLEEETDQTVPSDIETQLQPRLDETRASNFKELLETIRNAKLSTNGSSQLFKTKEEDTYSDVDYENFPDHYWETEFEVEEDL